MTATRLQRMRFLVNDITPAQRRAYRELRQIGVSRHDANMILVGICAAYGQPPHIFNIDGQTE